MRERERGRVAALLESIGIEAVAGVVLGGVAAWFLWNRLDEWTEAPAPPRSDRKLTPEQLAGFDGKGGRLCYVAVGTQIFDVSKERERFEGRGGTQIDTPEEGLDAFAKNFFAIGTLVIPRSFTRKELAAFDGRNGSPVYVGAKGKVYEVDKGFYGPDGPYGMMAGKDASRALALVSLDPADVANPCIDDLPASARSTLDEWVDKFEMKYVCVGYIVEEDGEAAAKPAASVAVAVQAPEGERPKPFLTKEKQQVVLERVDNLTHDTRLFRFALPNPKQRLGLPIGKHVKLWCPNPAPVKEGEWNGVADIEAGKAVVERKYTPSSLDDEHDGAFEMVIKVYRRGEVERFPDGGKMSQYLDSLKVGDKLDVAGPFGLVEYKGRGHFSIRKKDRHVKFVGMLAGGTGITPMLQLLKAVLRDPEDATKVSLIFANQTEDDILVRDMLDDLARAHPDRFRLHYTLDRPPPGWGYSQGFIDEDMIRRNMPPPSDDTIVLMCGPPPMVKFACKANLDKLGYAKTAQIEF